MLFPPQHDGIHAYIYMKQHSSHYKWSIYKNIYLAQILEQVKNRFIIIANT